MKKYKSMLMTFVSRPMRARELKLDALLIMYIRLKSRPMRARELKL